MSRKELKNTTVFKNALDFEYIKSEYEQAVKALSILNTLNRNNNTKKSQESKFNFFEVILNFVPKEFLASLINSYEEELNTNTEELNSEVFSFKNIISPEYKSKLIDMLTFFIFSTNSLNSNLRKNKNDWNKNLKINNTSSFAYLNIINTNSLACVNKKKIFSMTKMEISPNPKSSSKSNKKRERSRTRSVSETGNKKENKNNYLYNRENSNENVSEIIKVSNFMKTTENMNKENKNNLSEIIKSDNLKIRKNKIEDGPFSQINSELITNNQRIINNPTENYQNNKGNFIPNYNSYNPNLNKIPDYNNNLSQLLPGQIIFPMINNSILPNFIYNKMMPLYNHISHPNIIYNQVNTQNQIPIQPQGNYLNKNIKSIHNKNPYYTPAKNNINKDENKSLLLKGAQDESFRITTPFITSSIMNLDNKENIPKNNQNETKTSFITHIQPDYMKVITTNPIPIVDDLLMNDVKIEVDSEIIDITDNTPQNDESIITNLTRIFSIKPFTLNCLKQLKSLELLDEEKLHLIGEYLMKCKFPENSKEYILLYKMIKKDYAVFLILDSLKKTYSLQVKKLK